MCLLMLVSDYLFDTFFGINLLFTFLSETFDKTRQRAIIIYIKFYFLKMILKLVEISIQFFIFSFYEVFTCCLLLNTISGSNYIYIFFLKNRENRLLLDIFQCSCDRLLLRLESFRNSHLKKKIHKYSAYFPKAFFIKLKSFFHHTFQKLFQKHC